MNREMTEVERLNLNEERRLKRAVREFVKGAAIGDTEKMFAQLEALDYGDAYGAG